jgi:hypothetical protein
MTDELRHDGRHPALGEAAVSFFIGGVMVD